VTSYAKCTRALTFFVCFLFWIGCLPPEALARAVGWTDAHGVDRKLGDALDDPRVC
jgi:hypothetical protein